MSEFIDCVSIDSKSAPPSCSTPDGRGLPPPGKGLPADCNTPGRGLPALLSPGLAVWVCWCLAR